MCQIAARSSWSSSIAPRPVGCWWTPRDPLLPVTRLWPQSPSRSESGARDIGNCFSLGPAVSDLRCLVHFSWPRFLVTSPPPCMCVHTHTCTHTHVHCLMSF